MSWPAAARIRGNLVSAEYSLLPPPLGEDVCPPARARWSHSMRPHAANLAWPLLAFALCALGCGSDTPDDPASQPATQISVQDGAPSAPREQVPGPPTDTLAFIHGPTSAE